MQRRHLLSIAAVCGAAALSWQAQAQAQDSANWPVKPVRMLVGSAPGGGTDAMARAVADRLPFCVPCPDCGTMTATQLRTHELWGNADLFRLMAVLHLF